MKNITKQQIFSSTFVATSVLASVVGFSNAETVNAADKYYPQIGSATYSCLGKHEVRNPLGGTLAPGTMYLSPMTVHGKVAFCLDAATLQNNHFPLTEFKGYSGFQDIGYSKSQVDLLQKIVTVGYNMDHSAAMRAATQLRIWQVRRPDGYYGIPSDVQAKLNVINSRLKIIDTPVHLVKVSGNSDFDEKSQTIQFKGYGKENSITLKDTNGVLEHYVKNNAASNDKGLQLERHGNEITLWVEKNGNYTGKLKFDLFYLASDTNGDALGLVHPENQSMGIFESMDPNNVNLKYTVEGVDVKYNSVSAIKEGDAKITTNVKIKKTDKKTKKPIENVTFDIYRQESKVNEAGESYVEETHIGTMTTDAKGEASATFEQTQKVRSGRYVSQYIENFDELDKNTQNEVLGSGWKKSKAESEKEVNDLATQDLNELIAEFQQNKYTYVAKEVNSGKGYYNDPTNNIFTSEEIKGDGSVTFEVENQVIEGQISLEKQGEVLMSSHTEYTKTPVKVKDENGKEVTKHIITGAITEFKYGEKKLAGAEFDVIAAEDIKTASSDASVLFKKGDVVTHIVTSEDGTATTGNLPLGKYLIKETKAPEGFVIDETPIEMDLTTIEKDNPLIIKSTEVKNERVKTEVELTKVSSLTENKLNGAVFGIYATSDMTEEIKKGDLIEMATSDENGKVQFMSNLPLGTYEIKEIQAPKGYKVSKESILVELKYENDKINLVKFDKEVPNDFQELEFKVFKTDEKGKPITGKDFEFGLYEPDCKTEIQKVNGDDKTGTATFEDLTIGDYCVKETKAPEGFKKSEEEVKLNIKEYGEVYVNDKKADEEGTNIYGVTYKNDKIEEKEEVETGVSNNMFVWLISGISAGLVAISAILMKNRKNK